MIPQYSFSISLVITFLGLMVKRFSHPSLFLYSFQNVLCSCNTAHSFSLGKKISNDLSELNQCKKKRNICCHQDQNQGHLESDRSTRKDRASILFKGFFSKISIHFKIHNIQTLKINNKSFTKQQNNDAIDMQKNLNKLLKFA